jgi:hypothetical protein
MSRWVGFLIAVLLGIAAGLFYGWVINPVKYTDTPPSTLRADYKADYVLMVAEAYQGDHDLSLAARRLALLGDAAPGKFVQQSLDYASQEGYAQPDLDLMTRLANALQTWNPTLGAPQP